MTDINNSRPDKLDAILLRIERGDSTVLSEITSVINDDASSIDKVFDALEKEADKGNALFAEFVGYEYSFKYGSPRQGDAIKYLEIAARAHRSWAGYILSRIYEKKAQRYLRQAAEDGSPNAVKEYYQKLADARPDGEAAFELASDIISGLNIKAFNESTYWTDLIMHSDSEYSKVYHIDCGVISEESKQEALKYAKIAAEAGIPGALELLESLKKE